MSFPSNEKIQSSLASTNHGKKLHTQKSDRASSRDLLSIQTDFVSTNTHSERIIGLKDSLLKLTATNKPAPPPASSCVRRNSLWRGSKRGVRQFDVIATETIVTSSPPLTASRFSFTATSVTANLTDLDFKPGAGYRVDFIYASQGVPDEVSTGALAGYFLFGVIVLRRRFMR